MAIFHIVGVRGEWFLASELLHSSTLLLALISLIISAGNVPADSLKETHCHIPGENKEF